MEFYDTIFHHGTGRTHSTGGQVNSESDLEELQEKLGHRFNSRSLLIEALTHPSLALDEAKSYQRLEFVGDRVVNLVIAGKLFDTFLSASEGTLDSFHFACCSNYHLGSAALRMNLGQYLRIKQAPKEADKYRKNRMILAAAFEAVAGAIFFDSGQIYPVQTLLDKYLFYDLEEMVRGSGKGSRIENLIRLSETLFHLPVKINTRQHLARGRDHFTATITIGDIKMGSSTGPNAVIAQSLATRQVLRTTKNLTTNLPPDLIAKIQARTE